MARITDSDHPFIAGSYWFLRRIVGIFVRLIWIREVVGAEHIPQNGSAIIAFNHQSFFDFICFASISPRNIHFLAAEKFFENRTLSPFMLMTGQIRVDRDTHSKSSVHDSVAKHVKRGTLIGIFPEGTRSPHKEEMLKAFTGIAQFALKHRVPIIPVGITGTYDVMSKHDSKPKLKKIVDIKIGEPIHFHQYHGRETDKDACIEVTEAVMREIEKLSGKKYPHYESNKS